MFNSNTLASLIELPALDVPGGGVTAGLVTAEKQVRVLLRDLSGKASWDASILYHPPDHKSHWNTPSIHKSVETPPYFAINKNEPTQSVGDSLLITNATHGIQPHFGLRHRSPDVLPDVNNAAPDLDQLDDVSGAVFNL